MDLRSVSAEQRATLTRIRSLLKRAETWPMHGDDNLRQWIDEMRYLVPALLDRIAELEAQVARLTFAWQQAEDEISGALATARRFEQDRDAFRSMAGRVAAAEALLAERVAIDMIAVPTEDGPVCACCGAGWEYDGDTPTVAPGTEWHEDTCWVIRARAGLAEEP